jgi:hypothetical protein
MDSLDSVLQYNYDMCRGSLNGAKLSFTPGGPGSFQVAGVPSTCMVLATVLTPILLPLERMIDAHDF